MSDSADTEEKYPASRLLPMAREWLRGRYPDSIIVSEFCVGNWGSASIDVAAITEGEIIGLEIKGDGDSPARLPLQGCAYGRAATRMWLLAAPSIRERVFAKAPMFWRGLVVAHGRVRAEHNISTEPGRLPNCALSLTECLWKPELVEVAASLGVRTGKRDLVDHIQHALAEQVPLGKLRPAVVSALRRRKWRFHYDPSRISMPVVGDETVGQEPRQEALL